MPLYFDYVDLFSEIRYIICVKESGNTTMRLKSCEIDCLEHGHKLCFKADNNNNNINVVKV